MSVTTKIVVLFLSLCFVVSTIAGGFVLGNGADGLIVDSKLYLRDLVEAGVETQPYFGDKIDARLAERIKVLSIDKTRLPYSEELLVRKLSDLNRIYPYFGDYIFEALQSYQWLAVQAPLFLLPDPETVVDLPFERVQIANRLDFTIRVHHDSWMRLNDENRVALLIHEALYSLLEPVCEAAPSVTCEQPGRVARTFTGWLFSEKFFLNASTSVKQRLLPYIDVPFAGLPGFIPEQRIWSLSWRKLDSPVAEKQVQIQLPLREQNLEDALRHLCRGFDEDFSRNPGDYSLVSSMDLLPYEKYFVRYQTKSLVNGIYQTGFQTRLKIRPRKYKLKSELLLEGPANLKSCEAMIIQHFDQAAQDG